MCFCVEEVSRTLADTLEVSIIKNSDSVETKNIHPDLTNNRNTMIFSMYSMTHFLTTDSTNLSLTMEVRIDYRHISC